MFRVDLAGESPGEEKLASDSHIVTRKKYLAHLGVKVYRPSEALKCTVFSSRAFISPREIKGLRAPSRNSESKTGGDESVGQKQRLSASLAETRRRAKSPTNTRRYRDFFRRSADRPRAFCARGLFSSVENTARPYDGSTSGSEG